MRTLSLHRKSFRARLQRRARFLALLVGAVSASGNLMAQNSYWAPNFSGLWASTSNWSPNSTGGGVGVIPVASQNAIFSVNTSVGTKSVWLGANQAALGITVLGSNTGNVSLIPNQIGTTARNLTIGAGGITVNAGAGQLSMGLTSTSGLNNTLLLSSQTWTNNSASAISWAGRLIGHESTTLTKAGTGNLILSGTNQNQTATVNGATVTGLRGKIIVSAGTLSVSDANALGIRDNQTTAITFAGVGPLVSDTTVQSGASLHTNNTAIGNEFVTFEGSGVGGIGAIYNNTQANSQSAISQAKMSADARVGGTQRFNFGLPNLTTVGSGRFFQDGFTLTKSGAGTVGLVSTEVIGSGDMVINQGTLSIEGTTNLENALGATPSAGTGSIIMNAGTLNFNTISGSISRPIIHNGGTISHNSNDTIGNVNSAINSTAANLTINVSDDNSAGNQRGTLNLAGGLTSAGTITKGNSGVLNLVLHDSNFTGTAINVNGGQFDLLTSGAAIAANITLASGSTGANIQRPTIGGEGATNGALTFGSVASQANIVVFNGNTTNPGEHLRVGSVTLPAGGASSVEARLLAPAPANPGIVILESTAAHGLTNEFFFNGRGTLDYVTNPNQVLLNYGGTKGLVWVGNDATNPTFFDLKTSTNWVDGTPVAEQYFDGDAITFDDTVAGTTTVVPRNGAITPGNVTFNNNVNYLIDQGTAGFFNAAQSTFTKSGIGTTTIRTGVGSTANGFGTTTISEGVLELAWNNPGNASSATPVVTNLGVGGTVSIASGATLRNAINVPNSGFGANPTTIATGAVLDLTRGAVPNGTNTNTAAVTLSNSFSGGGDIILRGTNDTGAGFPPPVSLYQNQFGTYTLNGASPTFNGRFVLDNARIITDNQINATQGDELGSATIQVNPGSQLLLQGVPVAGAVDGQIGYHDGNIIRIGSNNGYFYEPAQAVMEGVTQSFGALRFNATSTTIGSSSSIVLYDNARITNQNQTSRILAPISEEGGARILSIGNPGATQNATLILGGNSTYTGGTIIDNTNVQVNSNNALGTGAVTMNGYTSARQTFLSVGNGVNMANPININSRAGQAGSRGVIEGGTALQVTELGGAGVGTISGPIAIAATENQVNTWAHFSAGQAVNSALSVTGAITVPAVTTIVQARSQNSGGYVEFSGGGNYSRFEVALGTVRLGANNGLANGTSLITRRIPDLAATGGGTARGVFDMRGFDQTVRLVSRSGTLTTSNFSLVNTGASASTLTINGTGTSDIQDIPLSINPVNIVKNGTASLLLSGSTAGLTGTGTYQINGGIFNIATGSTAAGSVDLRGTGTWTSPLAAAGGISGLLTVGNGGGILDPGASPGSLSAGSGALVGSGGQFDWEIDLASGVAGINYDVISIAGNLDLTTLTNFQINGAGLDGMGGIGAIVDFIPTQDYQWTLFAVAGTTSGFDAGDFVFNDTNFVSNNPTDGFRTFTVGLGTNGNDVVLNYNAVPEPSSIILLVTGLGVSLMSRRRTKSNLS
jgi:fibronectin-binding autotransporter adhesin